MMVFAKVNRRIISNVDYGLILLTLALCGIGLALLYSAGYQESTGMSHPMKRQAISMSIGAFAFVVSMFVHTSFWRRWSYLFYVVGCLLLLAIFFNGVVAGGARRWLEIGGFRMQPSEFSKLALILGLARFLSREKAPKDGYSLWTLVLPSIILAIPVVLIIREPDLGTALCHLLIGGSMLLIAGVKKKTLLQLFAACIFLTIPAWNFVLKDYQKQRVLTFLSPETDPLGSGYHAIQSKIAVGSGALSGKGFLKGTQTQLSFLPEQTTDFIFSVLAEEWGFLGSAIVLLIYGLLITRLLNIAQRSVEPFAAYVSIGVASLLFWHVIVNIGMVVGVLPVVGLTLALLSFGGSSAITVLAALGIVSGFSMRRYTFN
jgi:rod shape determining protein RodA